MKPSVVVGLFGVVVIIILIVYVIILEDRLKLAEARFDVAGDKIVRLESQLERHEEAIKYLADRHDQLTRTVDTR